jgi:hypothetical protein
VTAATDLQPVAEVLFEDGDADPERPRRRQETGQPAPARPAGTPLRQKRLKLSPAMLDPAQFGTDQTMRQIPVGQRPEAAVGEAFFLVIRTDTPMAAEFLKAARKSGLVTAGEITISALSVHRVEPAAQ